MCRPPDHRSRTEITTTGRERATPKYSRLIHWVVEGDLHRVGGGVVDIDNGSARSRFFESCDHPPSHHSCRGSTANSSSRIVTSLSPTIRAIPMSFDVLPRMREGGCPCNVRPRATCMAWLKGWSARLQGDEVASPVILLDILNRPLSHTRRRSGRL